MKCPSCNADLSAQKKCSKCGFNAADNRDELEVEYKDFKTSELLEIRHKKQTAPQVAETKIYTEQSGEGGLEREPSTATPPLKTKKSSLPILAAVGLILALIIGAFFLVRILVQQ